MASIAHHDASSAMPFGSVKYTDRTNPWSTTSVHSHPASSSRWRRSSSPRSSGRLKDKWSNWIVWEGGAPAGLANVPIPSISKNATVFSGPISKK